MLLKVVPLRGAAHGDDFAPSDARRMLDQYFGSQKPHYCAAERIWSPPTDIFETGDAIVIKMELAGVRDEDVQVHMSDNFLVIRGRRVDAQKVKPDNFHLMEIHYGRFERIFRLPAGLPAGKVTAVLSDGFLTVTVPKEPHIREICIEIE